MQADNFGWPRRIDALDLRRSLEASAANDQVVLATELAADLFDRVAHAARVFRAREIGQRLVLKWCAGGLNASRSLNCSHDSSGSAMRGQHAMGKKNSNR